MTEYFILFILSALLAVGLKLLANACIFGDRSYEGSKYLKEIRKWNGEKTTIWDNPTIKELCEKISKLVYLNSITEEQLETKLKRAGYNITPKTFTARKYLIVAAGVVGVLLCVLIKFWLGIVLVLLLVVFGIMRQREMLTSKLKERDDVISAEMPRFVRTICRNLRGSRDIPAALESYRKVAGPVLGAELDILLTHIRSGSVPAALGQFEIRLGTEAAFRLCSALREIDRGIDQSGTLEYLADDMARQQKLNIQRELSLRPGKIRGTYLPAVVVCVVMIIYVLAQFVMDQLNTLF